MAKRILLLFLAVFFVGCSQPDRTASNKSQDQWYEGKLTNGMQYHIYPTDKEPVSIRMVFHVGSFQENAQQQGYAHFVEHMAFNGSKNFTANEVDRMFEGVDAASGADLNAYTSYHETVYKIDLPNKSQFSKALLWMRDIGNGLTLDQAEVDKEKGVVLGEIRLSRPENKNLSEKFYLKMIAGTPYAEHDVLGSVESVKGASAESLRAFYEAWYQPQNAQLIVTGDINDREAQRLIEEMFSDWQATQRAPRPQKPYHELALADWVEVVGESESPSFSVLNERGSALIMNRDQRVENWLDDIALRLIQIRLNSVYDDAAQPVQELVAMPYYISQRRYNLFSVSFAESQRKVSQDLLVDTLASLRDHGVNQLELDSVLASYQRDLEDVNVYWNKRTASDFADDMSWSLTSDEPYLTRKEYRGSLEELLDEADLDKINFQIRDLLSEEMTTVIGRSKAEAREPLLASITPMANRLSQPGAKPLTLALVDSGLAEPEQPGTIVSQQEKYGMYVWQLSNGVEVWYEQDKSIGDQVFLVYANLGGKEALKPELIPAANMLTPVGLRSGIGELNGSALDAHLRRSSISVNPFLGVTDQSFEISTTQASVAEAFKLLYNIHTDLNIDERNVEVVKQELFEERARYFNSPIGRWNKAISHNIYQKDSVFFEYGNPDIALVTAAQIRQAYKALFQTKLNQKLVIIGDLQPAQLSAVLRQYIASIPLEAGNPQPFSAKYKSEFEPHIDLAVNNEKSTIYSARFIHKDVRLNSAKSVFIDDIIQRMLNNRLSEYVREDLGLDYAPSAIVIHADGNSDSDWIIEAQVAPNDASKVEKAIDKVVKNFVDSISTQEVSNAGKQLAVDLYPINDDAGQRAWFYTRYLLHDYGVESLFDLDATVADITLADVQQQIELYFGKDTQRFKTTLSPQKK